MKRVHIKILGLTVLIMGSILSSCEDFLDREPLAVVNESIFYQTPAQFEAAANLFYTRLGFLDGDAGSDLSNNQGIDPNYAHGNTVIPVTDNIWGDNYNRLRAVNQLLQKVDSYTGDPTEIAESVGTAYFFRAWHHYLLLKRFGGVPIVLIAPEPGDDIVYGARNSRYEVVAQILSDLDEAIASLPRFSSMGANELGKLSQEAARSFRARVLLYEATWEKYVGDLTDGDGSAVGAGSAMPEDYPTVESMLADAASDALAVMESGSFELWDHQADMGEDHLYYLFNLDDADSNPMGLSKGDNREFIWQTIYDYTLRNIGGNRSHARPHTASRKLMDMFLCSDGLPVQFSSDFQGYATLTSEFENRDHRLHLNSKTPLKQYWGRGAATEGGGAQYGVAFEESGFDYDYRFVTNLQTQQPRNNGYEGRKFTNEHRFRETGEEAFNYPLIRLAEVMLIYAEAVCELNDGNISDADLNISVNPIRARSGVAPLTNALIAPYPELSLLGEIRRERAIELFGENFRFDDLKRWNIAPDELNANVCANYITGTEWETADNPLNPGTPIYNAGAFSFGLTTEESSSSSYAGLASTLPGALIIEGSGARNFRLANYLDPIPKSQTDLNPNLLQNPGY